MHVHVSAIVAAYVEPILQHSCIQGFERTIRMVSGAFTVLTCLPALQLPWRNGWFYSLTKQAEQEGKADPFPFHTKLLRETGSV